MVVLPTRPLIASDTGTGLVPEPVVPPVDEFG